MSSGIQDRNGALENAGYSLVHNLTEAADRLGLKSKVQVLRGPPDTLFRASYPESVQGLGQQGVPITPVKSELPPKSGQRKLRVVEHLKSSEMHYLMERPDHSIMDPGTGRDHKDFNSMKGEYVSRGVSVVVEPR